MLLLPKNIFCGYFDCSCFGSLLQSKPRKCELFEIEFYLENAQKTVVDGTEYHILKNHILIAKPGQIRYSQLPFKTMYLKFPAESDLAELFNKMSTYFCCSHPQKIYDTINEMVKYQERNDLLLFYSRFLDLVSVIKVDSVIPTNRNGKNYAVVSQAKKFISEHYNEPLKLQDIAESVFLSKTYFQNIFMEVCGKTPHQYLIEKRVENAKYFLRNSDSSMLEIAEKTGFTCQQHFNRMFKKETGITPLAYRKINQNKYLQF